MRLCLDDFTLALRLILLIFRRNWKSRSLTRNIADGYGLPAPRVFPVYSLVVCWLFFRRAQPAPTRNNYFLELFLNSPRNTIFKPKIMNPRTIRFSKSWPFRATVFAIAVIATSSTITSALRTPWSTRSVASCSKSGRDRHADTGQRQNPQPMPSDELPNSAHLITSFMGVRVEKELLRSNHQPNADDFI